MILGVDPRVEFIPSCPDLTGQTGAAHRSDRCRVFVGICSGEHLVQWEIAVVFPGSVLGRFCAIWSLFDSISEASRDRRFFGLRWILFQGLENSLRLLEHF